MPLTVTEENSVADTEKARLAYISLHTGDPGTTGTNEATGGAYARQSLTWGSTSGGVTSASQVSFSVNAATYSHIGFWDAVTAGTFRGGSALAASQNLSSAGIVKVTPTLTVTVS